MVPAFGLILYGMFELSVYCLLTLQHCLEAVPNATEPDLELGLRSVLLDLHLGTGFQTVQRQEAQMNLRIKVSLVLSPEPCHLLHYR